MDTLRCLTRHITLCAMVPKDPKAKVPKLDSGVLVDAVVLCMQHESGTYESAEMVLTELISVLRVILGAKVSFRRFFIKKLEGSLVFLRYFWCAVFFDERLFTQQSQICYMVMNFYDLFLQDFFFWVSCKLYFPKTAYYVTCWILCFRLFGVLAPMVS